MFAQRIRDRAPPTSYSFFNCALSGGVLILLTAVLRVGRMWDDDPNFRDERKGIWTVRAVGSTPFVPFTGRHLCPINCPMDNLITVVTRFPLPAGVTADQIRSA